MNRFLPVLVLLAVNLVCASMLAGDVILTLDVTILPGNRVRLSGKSNLPTGTKLMLSVQEKIKNGFLGQSSCFVSDKGTFESEEFGPAGGLNDGHYVADVTMPIPAVQPAAVKAIIGKNGENLTGPLVEKGTLGVTVSRQEEFAIGANPNAAQVARRKEIDKAAVELKKQLCVYLEELLKFKDEPKFRQFGFGIGGPYNKWLTSVQALRDAQPKGIRSMPIELRAAPGNLLMLGMEYMQQGDTDFARQALPELKETIDYEAYLRNKKPRSAAKTQFRIWRDTTGKFSVDAELVSVLDDSVVLRKRTGDTINVPLSKLSDRDVQFVATRREK